MDLVRQMVSVSLVLALLACTLYWLRRKGLAMPRSRRLPHMEVTERLPLAPHHTLCLVRVADRALVLDVHAQGASLLASLDAMELDPPAAMAKGATR
jgi:flagellar biogenesis protein FliO